MSQMKPFRIDFQMTDGNSVSFRAHNKDENLMVAKSRHPEALDNLVVITGVNPEIQKKMKGARNHITILTKKGGSALVAAASLALMAKGDDTTDDDGVDPEANEYDNDDE